MKTIVLGLLIALATLAVTCFISITQYHLQRDIQSNIIYNGKIRTPFLNKTEQKRTLNVELECAFYIQLDFEYFDYVIPGKLNGINEAQVYTNKCVTYNKTAYPTGIVLITNFVPYFQTMYSKALHMHGGRAPTSAELDARISEILKALQNNLDHPNIKTVHVLVEDTETVDYLRSIPFTNSGKLIIMKTKHSDSLKCLLQYASICLQGEIVAITNQDNLFGEGWETINLSTLRKYKLMYALTRHPSRTLCFNTLSYYCGKIHGCHDTFVFYVDLTANNFNSTMVHNFTQGNLGMEEVVMTMFRSNGYTVTNPCFTLRVHHEHCVPIRPKRIHRVNGNHWAGDVASIRDINAPKGTNKKSMKNYRQSTRRALNRIVLFSSLNNLTTIKIHV